MTLNLRNLLVTSLFLKAIVALILPLTLDEYYYYIWGQYPSLSYFDHPPMVGWLMVLSQPLRLLWEGAIRWPFILLSHGTIVIWLMILKGHLSESREKLFVLVALLNPLWGMGVFVATPDIPLVFFWSLSLYFCKEVLLEDRFKDYLGLGLSLGFGFLSKYQIALFLPCLLLMLWQQKQLSRLLKPKAIFAILIALITCSPVFIWNAQHDWASIQFQWEHGMSSKHWNWTLPIEYALTQILIVFPTFLFFFFQKNKDYLKDWLLPFALFPFAFFLYSSFKARVEGNWVIMAIPTIYALASLYSTPNQWNWCRKTLVLWGGTVVIALGMVIFNPWLPNQKIKLFEAKKFDPIIEALKEDEKYFTFSYQLAAYMSFKKDSLYCKLQNYGRPDHFQFFPGCHGIPKNFIYITEAHDSRNFSEDFPGTEVKDTTLVGELFKFVEIQSP